MTDGRVRVAAYQPPLLPPGATGVALELIRERVRWCESEGVEILCCPEAILGGLADDAPRPVEIALNAQAGGLDAVIRPIASASVTTIVGFTEIDRAGRLYNSAAVCQRGSIAGVYRKQYPAINRSVYTAGEASPVFRAAGLTFGILLCRDSSFEHPARALGRAPSSSRRTTACRRQKAARSWPRRRGRATSPARSSAASS